MATYRDVKGLSVVALAEGKKVGQVDDLVVDPEARTVRWLRLGGSGRGLLGGGTSSWLRTDAVHSIGEHAVTIDSAAAVRQSEDVPDAVELVKSRRSLLGKKVLTEGGRFLGEARDFTFDPESFKLTGISLAQGMSMSAQTVEIDAQSLRTIGQDLIVVADGTQVTSRNPSEGERGEGMRFRIGRGGEQSDRPVAGQKAPDMEEAQRAVYQPFGMEGPVVEPPVAQEASTGQTAADDSYGTQRPATPHRENRDTLPGPVEVFDAGGDVAGPQVEPPTGRLD